MVCTGKKPWLHIAITCLLCYFSDSSQLESNLLNEAAASKSSSMVLVDPFSTPTRGLESPTEPIFKQPISNPAPIKERRRKYVSTEQASPQEQLLQRQVDEVEKQTKLIQERNDIEKKRNKLLLVLVNHVTGGDHSDILD